METAVRLGDNRKLFRLLHKATITQGMVSKMIQGNNGVPVKPIKDRLIKWTKFFEAIPSPSLFRPIFHRPPQDLI
ncbi:unnamed protein product [Dracunculus medinensis]|uniref:XRE family transcriptional regulator n=1 Tax=Dracunculus medinensis TaxID=318479 RepID=A0A0N4UQ84_DRAME|nr:unnamed protein product [Dracunculus medinensis]